MALAGLSLAGTLDALYMLAYEEGHIDSLKCPFFGEGCNIVGRSEHARHFGVPNAAVGAVGYAGMAALSLWKGRWQNRALAGIALAATGAGAFLTWEQKTKVRAWCFWCLSSAVLNVALAALSLTPSGTPRR